MPETINEYTILNSTVKMYVDIYTKYVDYHNYATDKNNVTKSNPIYLS